MEFISLRITHNASSKFDRNLLTQLAQPVPGRLLFQTAIEWFSICLLITVATLVPGIMISAVCCFLIATRQHALLTLMHEFSHYQFSKRNKVLNDFIGNIFTALPFFITVPGFRRDHLPHHQLVGTGSDPDYLGGLKKTRLIFPKTVSEVCIEIVKHCIGIYTLEELKRYTVDAKMSTRLPLAIKLQQVTFAACLIAILTWCHAWGEFLLYWIVPMSTFLMALLYIRDVGEHFGMPSSGILGSRTITAGWIERSLLCPNGVNYHAEHHVAPSVPFSRLAQFHRVLHADENYRRHAVATHGYRTGLLKEITRNGKHPDSRRHAGERG